MFRTFNMGIGMVAVVVAEKAARALELIYDVGYSARQIGVIEVRADGSPAVTLV
jgi:phosphoribosylaminoimidazole (AIR) synthetase